MTDRRTTERQRLREAVDRKAQAARARAEVESVESAERPPEAIDPRAKSSGHRKKTADKWNQ